MENYFYYLTSIFLIIYPLSMRYFTEIFIENKNKLLGNILFFFNLTGFLIVVIYNIDILNLHILGYGIAINLCVLFFIVFFLDKITEKYEKFYEEFLISINLFGLLTVIAFFIFYIVNIENYIPKIQMLVALIASILSNITLLIYAKRAFRK